MTVFRKIAGAGVMLLAGAGTASAQNGNVVLQPALFADSLAGIHDSSVVRNMERSVPALKDDADPEMHLRYALIEKRLFELTSDDDARKRAQHSFDKAKDQQQNNTWAHFGYGWALTHGPEFKATFEHYIPGAATLSALGGIFGLDAASRAKRSLEQALQIDPAFEPAVEELGRLALLTKQPKDVAEAASAARKAIGSGRATAGIYTQLAELETLRGNGAAAAEAARAAMTLRPDGNARHALGVALLAVPSEQDAGASAYLEGLTATAFGDTALATLYMTDVAPLLNDDDRSILKNLAINERAEWIRGFWERSAAKAGRSVGERLAEHFQRLQYALAHYQRGGKFGVRGGNAFIIDGDNSKLPFDDRGLMYVRLGKPDVVISTPPGNITPPPNESWVYRRDGKTEMYNFHKFAGTSNWVLSPLEECDPMFIVVGGKESDRHKDALLIPAGDVPSAPNGGIGDATHFIDYLSERARYDTSLGGYLARCQLAIMNVQQLFGRASADSSRAVAQRNLFNGGIQSLRQDARVIAQREQIAARAALKEDEARPVFSAPLEAITQLYAFRGKDNATDLTAAVLIPGERFTPEPKDGLMVYPLSLSLIVIDSLTGRIERNDIKPAFKSDHALAKGKWFRATVDLNASPTTAGEYRVVVENIGKTGEGDVRAGTREIPNFTTDSLTLSDIVVGEPGNGRWKRGTADINPIPTHQVEQGKQFKLFYEIYNMPAKSKFRTSISLIPKQSGGLGGAIKSIFGKGKPVELNFDETAGTGNGIYGLQQLRAIGADRDPGEYDLVVTITNIETQAKATRKTKLIVLGPKDLRAK